MKYTVHLYKAVRITMEDVEANSQEEATRIADENYEHTRYHEGPGAKAYLGDTLK